MLYDTYCGILSLYSYGLFAIALSSSSPEALIQILQYSSIFKRQYAIVCLSILFTHIVASLLHMHILYTTLDLNRPTSDQAENPPLVLAVFRFSDDVAEEPCRLTDRFSFISVPLVKREVNSTFQALLQCASVRENVNKTNRAGITALHAACRRGNTAMVDILLKVEGIEIDKQDKHGNTPLHSACASGNLTTVATLIKNGADYKLTNKLEMHPFHVAVTVGKLDAVAMIRNDSRVSKSKEELLCAKEEDGNTMFLLAVRGGHDSVVEFLLQIGAQIDDINKDNANAFHLAAAVNSCSIMEKIYTHDPGMSLNLIEAKDSSSLTPLHYAAKRNQKDVVSFLIEK